MSKFKGIDVSKHNGTINWSKVKNNGIEFAIIRAGYCGYAGNIVQDSQFAANMKGALEVGLDVGVYLYSYAKTAKAAKTAANELLNLIAPYDLTYPVVFDIEDEINISMSKAENTAISKSFLMTIADAGYVPMLYTFKSFAESNLTMSDLPYDFWVAHIGVDKTTYSGDYTMWQYSWTGKVDGISTDVDMNYCYKDYPSLLSYNPDENDIPVEELPDNPDESIPVEQEDTTYTVVKNDNLTNIAKSFGVPLRSLIQANQTVTKADGTTRKLDNPNLIYVGEILKIPSKPN